jgi:hypothetical protein
MRPRQPLTHGEALRELLHDAEEGLLGIDAISPLKPHLGPDFKAVNDRLRAAIDTRYRLTAWGADYAPHKEADLLAAASEAVHVTGWSRGEIRESLRITLDPVDEDPLPVPAGMRQWEPWPPRLAAALFLAKLRELIQAECEPGDVAQLECVVTREQRISELAACFSRLPRGLRRKCAESPTGSSLSDTFVFAEAQDFSSGVEGVVVDGERDENGEWNFDADFTLFTTDGELLVCHGYNCDLEIQ